MKLLFVFLTGFTLLYPQEKEVVHTLLRNLSIYNFNQSDSLMLRLGHNSLEELFQREQLFFMKGQIIKDSLKPVAGNETVFVKAICFYLLGRQKERIKLNDKDVFEYYKVSLGYAKEIEDSLLTKEILIQLIYYLGRFSDKDSYMLELREKYLQEYELLASEPQDFFRFFESQLITKMQNLEKDSLFSPNHDLEITLKLMQNYARETPYFKAQLHKLHGIYSEVFKKNLQESNKHFRKAHNLLKDIPFYYAQKQLAGIQISLGIVLFRQEKYSQAIDKFSALINEKSIVENPVSMMYLNDWLYKSHLALKDHEKALHYFTEFKDIYTQLDRKKHARLILKMDAKDEVKEKEILLTQLKTEKITLRNQILILIPIAGGLLICVLFILWLYKKIQSKKVKLESEKEDTLKEVRALTKLVIKNHIILKDKTKVYINDLMYIKAEDHYIRTFTSNGKNQLVRGRLSDLDEQPPPNFILTHRSNITNRNFVMQISKTILLLLDASTIPISRKFKDLLP